MSCLAIDRLIAEAEAKQWQPMDSAPRDGRAIVGLFDGEQVDIRWASERVCMLAGTAGGNGYFGPGWEDVENHLVCDEPSAWKPTAEAEKEEAEG